MAVSTKAAERRPDLSFDSLDALAADLDRIEASHNAGTLRHTGNWTPGQVFQHCAKLMQCSLDGFPPGAPPAPVRWMVMLFFKKKAVAGHQPPPGIKLPQKASYLIPEPDISFDDGLESIRTVLRRMGDGDRFTHPSPIFGKLTHDQWTRLHLGHCALHLSFLHPE